MASKLDQCNSCKRGIEFTSTLIICEGTCRRSYHPECVDLDIVFVNGLKGSHGLSWRCPKCRVMPPGGNEDGLRVLEDKCEANFLLLNRQLEAIQKSLVVKPRKLWPSTKNQTPLSRGDDDSSFPGPAKRRYISPLDSDVGENGMIRPEIMVCDGEGDPSLVVASPLSNRNFDKFLFVSNMHRSVETDAIIKHVCDKLKVEKTQVLCHKLVKRDADISGFRFVSFKVGVERELFEKINNFHFWPAGSKIKEFINNRPKNWSQHAARLPPVQQPTLKTPLQSPVPVEELISPVSAMFQLVG